MYVSGYLLTHSIFKRVDKFILLTLFLAVFNFEFFSIRSNFF